MADRQAPLDQRPVEVRHADEPRESLSCSCAIARPRLLDRHVVLRRPVDLIQVDVVAAEPAQRPPDGSIDVLRARTRREMRHLGEHHRVRPAKDDRAHQLLGPSVAVRLRGVIQSMSASKPASMARVTSRSATSSSHRSPPASHVPKPTTEISGPFEPSLRRSMTNALPQVGRRRSGSAPAVGTTGIRRNESVAISSCRCRARGRRSRP